MLLRLIRKINETPDTLTFVFEGDEPVSWKAGQYGTYRLEHPNPDNRKTRRFFTIAAPPYEGRPQITTRINPKGSSFKKALQSLGVGGKIELLSVSGDFVMDKPEAHHVMIAGGIGITPYHSIIRQLDHDRQPINITLLYANRTEDFVFKKIFDKIAANHQNFIVNYFAEPKRIDEAAIRDASSNLTNPTFWISGPEPMVEAFEQTLAGMGILKDRVKTDFFPGYKWPES